MTHVRAARILRDMAPQTSVIERHDRVRGGEVSDFIAKRIAEGASHREIAVDLADTFGIDVNRTTVLRFLKRQAAA